jgi:hypothetical protein
VLLMMND